MPPTRSYLEVLGCVLISTILRLLRVMHAVFSFGVRKYISGERSVGSAGLA